MPRARVKLHAFKKCWPALRDVFAGTEETVRISDPFCRRFIAGCLVLLLLTPFAVASPSPQQATQATNDRQQSEGAQAPASQPPLLGTEPLPNSPGAVRSQTVAADQPIARMQESEVQEPVGTAAAPPVKTTGVAASRPAGAAIAPGKQRRARSLLIKVGALVGAGVAIGTVVALSSGSPSRPPGSH